MGYQRSEVLCQCTIPTVLAFHTAIPDILRLALIMCSVSSAWDLKIHCCIDLFSRCRCALSDCRFRFVGLAVLEMKYFGMCHTHFYDKNVISHKMGKSIKKDMRFYILISKTKQQIFTLDNLIICRDYLHIHLQIFTICIQTSLLLHLNQVCVALSRST